MSSICLFISGFGITTSSDHYLLICLWTDIFQKEKDGGNFFQQHFSIDSCWWEAMLSDITWIQDSQCGGTLSLPQNLCWWLISCVLLVLVFHSLNFDLVYYYIDLINARMFWVCCQSLVFRVLLVPYALLHSGVCATIYYGPWRLLIDTLTNSYVDIFVFHINFRKVLFREDATVDDLIDVIEGNRKYMKCVYVYNKIDVVGIDDVDRLARQPNSIVISCNLKVCISFSRDLTEYLFLASDKYLFSDCRNSFVAETSVFIWYKVLCEVTIFVVYVTVESW